MPTVQKLSTEEVERVTKRRTTVQDLTEYTELLNGLKPGDWGRLTLAAGESSRVVKRRLTLASKQRGLRLFYKKVDKEGVLFTLKV
jgi:hypothetical protein